MSQHIRSIAVTVGFVLVGGVGVASALGSLGGDPALPVPPSVTAPAVTDPAAANPADAAVESANPAGVTIDTTGDAVANVASNPIGDAPRTVAATADTLPSGSIVGVGGDDDDDDDDGYGEDHDDDGDHHDDEGHDDEDHHDEDDD